MGCWFMLREIELAGARWAHCYIQGNTMQHRELDAAGPQDGPGGIPHSSHTPVRMPGKGTPSVSSPRSRTALPENPSRW